MPPKKKTARAMAQVADSLTMLVRRSTRPSHPNSRFADASHSTGQNEDLRASGDPDTTMAVVDTRNPAGLGALRQQQGANLGVPWGCG